MKIREQLYEKKIYFRTSESNFEMLCKMAHHEDRPLSRIVHRLIDAQLKFIEKKNEINKPQIRTHNNNAKNYNR